jgi:DNA-binding XRE family transcriptional regulator
VDILKNLGGRIREYRRIKFPSDTQESFALRLNINKNTLSAMENGKPTVAIGSFLKAAELLGCDQQFEELFKPERKSESLFDQFDS